MIIIATIAILLSALCREIDAIDYLTPGATFDAKAYTTWNSEKVGSSRRAEIYVDFTGEDGTADFVHMYRLDLVGNAYERGYAQGYLMSRGNFR